MSLNTKGKEQCLITVIKSQSHRHHDEPITTLAFAILQLLFSGRAKKFRIRMAEAGERTPHFKIVSYGKKEAFLHFHTKTGVYRSFFSGQFEMLARPST